MSQPDRVHDVDHGPDRPGSGMDDIDTDRTDEARGPTGWAVDTTTGTAQWFHDRKPSPDTDHRVWIHHVRTEAVVVGSAQSPNLIRSDEAEQRRLEVCRRHSGGGLVHVQPETDIWIDIVLPRHSPLWDDDIGRSFHWLGRHWAHVLERHYADRGVDLDWMVGTGAVRRAEGRLLCFADVGHGEVLCRDRKVVGLSQRRTRHWARLQGLFVARSRHYALLPVFDIPSATDILFRADARSGLPGRDDDVGADDGSDPLDHERRLATVLSSLDQHVGLPVGCPPPDRNRLIKDFCRLLPAV